MCQAPRPQRIFGEHAIRFRIEIDGAVAVIEPRPCVHPVSLFVTM